MKKIFALCCFLLIAGFSFAQNTPSLKFETMEADLGKVAEDGESPVAVFRFKNVSGKPVVITQVATTCGCTVAEYSEEPLAAGAEGFVRLTYNPKGRVGAILRSVQLFTSNNEKPYRLLIKGEVLAGRPRKHASYPYVAGNLQLRNQTVRFSGMRGEEQLQEVMVINQGTSPLRVTLRSSHPYLSGSMNPAVLAPDQKGVIEVTRLAKGCPDPGEAETLVLQESPESKPNHLILEIKRVKKQ